MTENLSGSLATGRLPAAGDLMLRLTGEITTKGRRTRSRFQKKLVKNLRDGVESSGAACRMRSEWSRLYLRSDQEVTRPLARVFGISTFSALEAECAADLSQIVDVGLRTFGERVKGRSFAVRARRSGTHPFSSQHVMQQLGAALGEDARVDLGEGRGGRAAVAAATVRGPGVRAAIGAAGMAVETMGLPAARYSKSSFSSPGTGRLRPTYGISEASGITSLSLM